MPTSDAPARGTLYVVATPIGNLDDITLRALRVLGEVDLIAAEDTRRTRVLLEHHGIRGRLVAYHDHVESERAGELVQRLLRGESVALVSDAGTPLIADPGYRLLRAAADAGVPIVPVPGPCAPIALLSCAALPTDRFTFVGFLPSRRSARRRVLLELAGRRETLVFLESPRRLGAALADLCDILGAERPAVLGRELTKRFEEVRRGTLGELAARLATSPGAETAADEESNDDETEVDETDADASDADVKPNAEVEPEAEPSSPGRIRGEIVLAVGGAAGDGDEPARSSAATRPADLDAFLRARLASGDSVAAAARAAVQELGVQRREAYRRASDVRRSL